MKAFLNIAIFVFSFLIISFILYNKSSIQSFSNKKFEIVEIFKSDCDCKRNNVINIIKNFNIYQVYQLNTIKNELKLLYNLTENEYKKIVLTCDFYHVLRRGKNQKILTFSLYGKNLFYYQKLRDIVRAIKKYYPGWFIRIYYDDSIEKSIICEIECLQENQNLLDNADFCYSKNVRLNFDSKVLNTSLIFPSMYRFFTLVDSFVDVFLSRDTDSFIYQREIDAVNEFLASDKYAHIMRDHPAHVDLILAGMWGAYNSRNQTLSNQIYKLMTDNIILKKYFDTGFYKKEVDQKFLADYIYPMIENHSIIHDSYHCAKLPSIPWPSKREGDCFVGSKGGCSQNNNFYTCPVECRKNKYWIYC